jgi:hypothetical protein
VLRFPRGAGARQDPRGTCRVPRVPGSLPLATISHLLPEAGDECSAAASSGCRVSSWGASISGAPGGQPNLDKCIACDRGHLTERMCAIVQALYSYS